MERYGTHREQTYRTNFNRGRAKCIDWVKLVTAWFIAQPSIYFCRTIP